MAQRLREYSKRTASRLRDAYIIPFVLFPSVSLELLYTELLSGKKQDLYFNTLCLFHFTHQFTEQFQYNFMKALSFIL